MNITDILTMDGDGDFIQTETLGDNTAINCIDCYHPILASSKDGSSGCDEELPVTCKGCRQKFFLDIRKRAEKLYIHAL